MRTRASEQRSIVAMQATAETTENAIAKAYVTGDELSITEQLGLEAFFMSFILLAECDFRLYRDGLISSDDWIPTRSQLKLVLYSTHAQSWWNLTTNQLVSEGFRAEVNALIAEIDGQPNPYEQGLMKAPSEKSSQEGA